MNLKIISLLKLLHCRGLGNIRIKKLIKDFESPEKVIEAGWNSRNNLLFDQWPGGNWEQDYEIVEKEKVRLISFLDPEYPQNLLKISDFPLMLYVKGENFPLEFPKIALIGTRNASFYGKEQGEKLAFELARKRVIVISGLARGIDTAAHLGALRGNGVTYAVIGSGLSKVYPNENRFLSEKIIESGALISELPMMTAPNKGTFPRRNRIVSGIAEGICLIESPLNGGGMITMDLGSKFQKPLFALPGRVDYPTFAGNNYLIKERKAILVENSLDLIKHLEISEIKSSKPDKHPNKELTELEEAFLEKLPFEEKTLDELVLLTQLPIMQLNVLLTRLVLKKLIKEFPGKIYKRMSDLT